MNHPKNAWYDQRGWTLGLIICGAMLSGCATKQPRLEAGKGNVSDFILQEAMRQKAQPNTNGLPVLTEPWQYSVVKTDVFVRLKRPDYDKAKAFLTQAFGAGQTSTDPSAAAAGVVEYRFNQQGGGIQLSFDPHSTWMMFVRPGETRLAHPRTHPRWENPEQGFWKSRGDQDRGL